MLGAAIGGLAATGIGIAFDALGDAMGWWRYTMGTTAYGPPLMYVAVWLWYGVGVTLLGWRVSRAFGWRGFIGFIGFMAVYGPSHDYVGVALTRGTVQVISSGIPPLVADVVLRATANAVAQGVMWLISGSPESDQFARRPFRVMVHMTGRHGLGADVRAHMRNGPRSGRTSVQPGFMETLSQDAIALTAGAALRRLRRRLDGPIARSPDQQSDSHGSSPTPNATPTGVTAFANCGAVIVMRGDNVSVPGEELGGADPLVRLVVVIS